MMSLAQRKKLIDTFLEMNQKINLSAIRNPNDVYTKHILDALQIEKIIQIQPGRRVCDVGMGGGFPILPVAVTYPKTFFVGVDSVKKKCLAVEQISQECGLKNVSVVWSRAEEYREQFDMVVSRSVAYADKLFHYTVHLVKPGGYLAFYKMYTPQEDVDIKKLCSKYHFMLKKSFDYSLFDGDVKRKIYLLKKSID